MKSHLLCLLWFAVPSFSYISQPCTVTDAMTRIDFHGTCQKTGTPGQNDGGCTDGASVPGGCMNDDKTVECCISLVCRDGNFRCKNAFKGCGKTSSWTDGEWALDTCPLSTESNPIMCCINDPRALGLPSPADGLTSFNLQGTEGVEGSEPVPETDPEPAILPWNWDSANVDLPETEAQIGGFNDLASATDSSSFDDFGSDDGQYPHFVNDWAALG